MHEPVAPEPVTIAHRTDDDARTPVDAERLVAGQPLQAVANACSSADDAFHCGIWEGDAGAWRVRYTEHELCHMLAGRVRITGEDGAAREYAAGESFVIPAGFSGVWEVLEPARKLYAVYEPVTGAATP